MASVIYFQVFIPEPESVKPSKSFFLRVFALVFAELVKIKEETLSLSLRKISEILPREIAIGSEKSIMFGFDYNKGFFYILSWFIERGQVKFPFRPSVQ